MTRDGRSLLLLALLMTYGLLAVESRYREDTAIEARRHRHRHRHETSPSGRSHREPTERRSSWSREVDYDYDDLDEDSEEDDEDEYYDDQDYQGVRSYHERPYMKAQRNGYQQRTFESRYPRHHRESYRGWYRDEEKRRTPSRYNWRNRHRSRLEGFGRSRHRGGYSRNREAFRDELGEEDEEEEEEERSARRYEDDTGPDNHSTSSSSSTSPWRNSKKHRSNRRRDWRGNGQGSAGYRYEKRVYDENDLDSVRKFKLEDQRRRRPNSSERIFEDYVDGESEEEGEDDDIRREIENEEDEETEDDDTEEGEELDNDFYKNEKKKKKKKKSALNTYDDIIRRLTSEDPSTVKPTVKRDYRNVGTDKYPWRLSNNGNNNTGNVSRNLVARPKVVGSSYASGGSSYLVNKKPSEGVEVEREVVPVDRSVSMISSASAEIERKPSKNVISVVVKDDDEHSGKAKTKSLEQDYDDYLNTEDNEKEEDLIKAGIEDDSEMQSDVTNTDYNDDETAGDHESTANTRSTTTSTTSTTIATTSSTSTTSTTTTTPKPTLTQHFDYRDARSYDSSTGTQYNGYQAKNDYPPMSAHSLHKWQSLGTRESVKETRSNMQQFNKNGRSAEIREALQHAIKVSREGSCQWPRPRVIPVRDVYPSPSTTYTPHCVILHRCSDDTGCCRYEALTCVPKDSHPVELSFYLTSVAGSSVVKKLSFYNHTECECRDKTEYGTNDKLPEQRFHRHHQPFPQPQNMRRASPRKSCRCPSDFTPKITSDGECQCHCYEHNQNCIKTRRGKGYFSLSDRLCIQNTECATPSCEFGEYMRREGRCPRKRERFEAIANFHTNMNHRYRS